MNVTIQKVTAQESGLFIELLRVFEAEFEMDDFRLLSPAYLQQLLQQERFWVFVAMVDEAVVGGLTAHVLPQYYTKSPQVYLYDLAVSRDYQRRGVGRQLVAEITAYCRPLGIDQVFVQADGGDQDAIDFYRATGGRAASVVHFTYPLAGS